MSLSQGHPEVVLVPDRFFLLRFCRAQHLGFGGPGTHLGKELVRRVQARKLQGAPVAVFT